MSKTAKGDEMAVLAILVILVILAAPGLPGVPWAALPCCTPPVQEPCLRAILSPDPASRTPSAMVVTAAHQLDGPSWTY